MLRALIDQGSQTSFITEEATQRLNLKKIKNIAKIVGIGAASAGTSNHSTELQIHPRNSSDFTLTVKAMILKSLTRLLPK